MSCADREAFFLQQNNQVASEILLVDPKTELRDAQVQDLSDATYHGNTSTRVRAAEHAEAGQCDVIVVTAGAAQKKGESRTDLIGRNQAILSSVIKDMKPFNKEAILLLIANPVDILAYFALQYSGLPATQVIGSGTFLDSARLRGALAAKASVAASSIDAFVIGEHGTEANLAYKAAWSSASVAGIPLHQYPATKSLDREAIATETRQKASRLIENKGSTEFGIGSVTTSICKSILFDQRNVRPVSVYDEELKVYLSRPVILGRKGIEEVLELPLDDGEQKALKASAESLRSVIEEAEEKQKEAEK
ncbi:hypothetical protein MBLNU13_g04909t2 [Cladosporium sp. NU13]